MNLGDFVRWLLKRIDRFLRKFVTPTVVSKVSLSVTQGATGSQYNLLILSTENGAPDTTDTPIVTVTAPDGTTTPVANVGAPNATGLSTTALIAGAQSGNYVYSVTVGGDAQPSATFTRSELDIPELPCLIESRTPTYLG